MSAVKSVLEQLKKTRKDVSEGAVNGSKIDYAKMKQELVSTAFYFIDGLREKKISFEYDADKNEGKIFLKNLVDAKFSTGGENIWLEGPFKDVSLKGALTALTVVQKMVELDNFTSKAK
jgi:hypothetical protein